MCKHVMHTVRVSNKIEKCYKVWLTYLLNLFVHKFLSGKNGLPFWTTLRVEAENQSFDHIELWALPSLHSAHVL